MLKGLASLSLSLVFLSSGTIVLAAESGYVARSNLMQNIRSEFSVLARMAQEKIQFDESLAESTRLTLLNLAASAPTIFEDNELPINSEALPAIWENWEDFVEKADDFAFMIEGLETSSADTLAAGLGNIGQSCGSCHTAYRIKK